MCVCANVYVCEHMCTCMHVSTFIHACCVCLHEHMHVRGQQQPTSSGDILLVQPVTILTRVARLLLVLVAICIPALRGSILLGRLAAHNQSSFDTVQPSAVFSHATSQREVGECWGGGGRGA